jgi:hypothetical protein
MASEPHHDRISEGNAVPVPVGTVTVMARLLTLTEASSIFDISRTRLRELAKTGVLGNIEYATPVGARQAAMLVSEDALIAAGISRRHQHPGGRVCIETHIETTSMVLADVARLVEEMTGMLARLADDVAELRAPAPDEQRLERAGSQGSWWAGLLRRLRGVSR